MSLVMMKPSANKHCVLSLISAPIFQSAMQAIAASQRNRHFFMHLPMGSMLRGR